MTPIENKELRGITARLIYTIIISTAIIVFSGAGAYYGLKMDNEIRKIEVEALRLQVNSIQVQLDRLIDESNKRNAKEAK